jgi:hypothetical protein
MHLSGQRKGQLTMQLIFSTLSAGDIHLAASVLNINCHFGSVKCGTLRHAKFLLSGRREHGSDPRTWVEGQ